MIPRLLNECPNGTLEFKYEKKKTCCCVENHNSCWNECPSEHPQETCLQGLDAFWMKDPRKNIWIAQERIDTGNTTNTEKESSNGTLTNDIDEIINTTGR